jgi:hypothetical protein
MDTPIAQRTFVLETLHRSRRRFKEGLDRMVARDLRMTFTIGNVAGDGYLFQVYSEGTLIGACKIWSGGVVGSYGIAYHEGEHVDAENTSAFSSRAMLVEGTNELRFRLDSASRTSTSDEVIDHLWKRFARTIGD